MTDSDAGISRQRRVGEAAREETKRRLVEAAADEFAENGYAGATVNRIARRAGVTVQTLYLAWGSKRELLRAYMSSAVTQGPRYPERVLERFAGLSPRETIREVARLMAEITSRSATGWQVYVQAAVADRDIAEDWQQFQMMRRETFERALAGIPDQAFRDGLPRQDAIDTAWTIASPGSYDLLVRRRGYTLDDFERWVDVTLTAALLSA